MNIVIEKFEDAYYFFKRTFESIEGTIKGWWRQSNKLHTNLPYSFWYDKTMLIPEALFYAVDDFVSRDGEDAFGIVEWGNDEHHQRVRNKIIQILHWFHIERPHLEKKYDYYLEKLYGTPEKRLKFCNGEVIFPERSLEDELNFDNLQEIERVIYRKNKFYSKMVCDIIGFLWC